MGPDGETFIKNQFKELFEMRKTEIFNTIWNNQQLRGSLFPELDDYNEALMEFEDLITQVDNNGNPNSILYSFIKSE